MRVAKEVLDEIIQYNGNLKHWPLNADGVLKLALDLRDARSRVSELEAEVADLGGIAEGVLADVKKIRAKLAPAQPTEPNALAAFKADNPPNRKRKHRKRAIQP